MANIPEDNAITTVFRAIALSKKLSSELVLKGGNALKHVYKSPRASVDLDFTELESYSNEKHGEIEKVLDEISTELNASLRNAIHLHGFTNMLVQSSKIQPVHREIRENPSLELKVGYTKLADRDPPYMDVVKLEITLNDVICEDQLYNLDGNKLKVSTLNDIIAEKLRALIQQIDRNRYRPRDVFDIWFFHTRLKSLFNYKKISAFLIEKSKGKLDPKVVKKSTFLTDELKKRSAEGFSEVADTVNGVEFPSFDEAYQEVLKVVKNLTIPK